MKQVDLQSIVNSINDLSSRLLMTSIAVEELSSRLPTDAKKEMSERLRLRAAQAMQMREPRNDAVTDNALTSQLHALLAALGDAPKG